MRFGLPRVRKLVGLRLDGCPWDGAFHRGWGKGLSDRLFASAATPSPATPTAAGSTGLSAAGSSLRGGRLFFGCLIVGDGTRPADGLRLRLSRRRNWS